MDDFLKKFFPHVYIRKQSHLNETDYCKYDNQLLTLFTSSLYFSALVITFAASPLTKKKGRKASIIVGSISFLAGAIINAAAENIAMLIIGRVLLGGGIGFANQVSQMLQNRNTIQQYYNGKTSSTIEKYVNILNKFSDGFMSCLYLTKFIYLLFID